MPQSTEDSTEMPGRVNTLGAASSPLCLLSFLTQHQGGNEGCGHAAGTQQEGMRDTKVAIGDPAKDDGGDGCQKAHHRGLHLGRDVVTWRAWSRVLWLRSPSGLFLTLSKQAGLVSTVLAG